MKNKAALSSRSRSEILGAIASIPRAVQGKICEMHKTLAGGKTATYYNLQYWSQGKNHSVHIPRERLDEFREAVEGGMKLRSLDTELGESDVQDILSSAAHLKKKNLANRPQGSVAPSSAHGISRRLRGKRRNRMH